MSKKVPKKTTSVQKYKNIKKQESDSESDEEIEKKVLIKKKPIIIENKELVLDTINCNKCSKELDLEKEIVFDYCQDCNTLLNQCKLTDMMSIFTALNSQLKQLYNDNMMLIEKIKLLETNKNATH